MIGMDDLLLSEAELPAALRAPPMSVGLAASTVTPGRIPPDASLTTPVMLLCAQTVAGSSRINPTTRRTTGCKAITRTLTWQRLGGGPACGEAARGFARLNFGTPLPVLEEIVDRIGRVLAARA